MGSDSNTGLLGHKDMHMVGDATDCATCPHLISLYSTSTSLKWPYCIIHIKCIHNLLRAINVCLTSLDPPSPIAELEDTEVDVVGSDVVLKCAVHGDPRPQYKWSYPWVSNVWVKTEDGVSLLHINGTTEANIGTYACFAFNKLGEARRSVRVTVKGKGEHS